MLLFKFILLSFFFLSLSFSIHGRSRFLCPDVTLYVHSSFCYVILSFSPIIFLYLFLFIILKFVLNLYHSIISLSVLHYKCYSFLSHFSLNRSLYSFFFSYIILFSVSICYSLFPFLCSILDILLSFFFVSFLFLLFSF